MNRNDILESIDRMRKFPSLTPDEAEYLELMERALRSWMRNYLAVMEDGGVRLYSADSLDSILADSKGIESIVLLGEWLKGENSFWINLTN